MSYEFLEELKNKYKNDLLSLINPSSVDCTTNEKDVEVRSKVLIENGYVFDEQPRSVHINNNNKLRTYSIFKKDVGVMEPYLKLVDHRSKRSVLARFRMGVLPLRIETGRYELVLNNRGIPVKFRVCQCCDLNKIEDEIHFLLECPCYVILRKSLFDTCKNFLKEKSFNFDVQNISDINACFSIIMSTKEQHVVHAVASFVWRAICIRAKKLKNLYSSNQ